MIRRVLLLAVLGVGPFVAACAPPLAESLDPLVAKEIVGIWKQGETVFHLQFSADGTFRSAESIDGLESDPIDFGTYQLDGTRFTFMSSSESPICPGHTGTYQIRVDTEGRILLEREKDECPNRQSDSIPPLIQVLP